MLPNSQWQYDNSLKSNFNNQLLNGLNQGLNLYSPSEDLKLFKPLDNKSLDKLNFDNLNEDLNTNRNIFENIKSGANGFTKGVVSGVADASTDSFMYLLKSILSAFGLDPNYLTTYVGAFLVFLIIYKKI